jgi:hypothetical protein
MKSKEEKILQVVNLSPDESVIEKLAEIHPIRQAAYASIVQLVVLGFMFSAMALINSFL